MLQSFVDQRQGASVRQMFDYFHRQLSFVTFMLGEFLNADCTTMICSCHYYHHSCKDLLLDDYCCFICEAKACLITDQLKPIDTNLSTHFHRPLFAPLNYSR